MEEQSTERRDDSAIDPTSTAGLAAERGELTSDIDNPSLVKEVSSTNKDDSTTYMGDEASGVNDSDTGMKDASTDKEAKDKAPTDINDSSTGKADSTRENNAIHVTDIVNNDTQTAEGSLLKDDTVQVESDTSTETTDTDRKDSEGLTTIASTDGNNSTADKEASSANDEGKNTTVMSDSLLKDKAISSAEEGDRSISKRVSPEGTLTRTKRHRDFKVLIYERDYKELCAWVLKCENIETGGDLFGVWADKRTAVIQLVVGPGKQCRRTSVSFYQDVPYLERVGSYVTQHEGLCHIGEWHSHHRMGLARPSGGDERTVWSNMPSYKLNRFVIFIANIQSARNSDNVNIGCFLFEIETKSYQELPIVKGEFEILPARNPFSAKREVLEHMSDGAEIQNKEDELGELTLEKAQGPKCVRHKKETSSQGNGDKRKTTTSGQQNTRKNDQIRNQRKKQTL